MRLKLNQLRRVIRRSILKEYKILDGPFEPHVNQKKHAAAMRDVELFASEIANTTGPGLALERMAMSYPDFVDDCEARAEANGLAPDDAEDLFVQCAVDYCHDFSEKEINRFLTAMGT